MQVPKDFLLQMLGEEWVMNFVIQEIVSSTLADYAKKASNLDTWFWITFLMWQFYYYSSRMKIWRWRTTKSTPFGQLKNSSNLSIQERNLDSMLLEHEKSPAEASSPSVPTESWSKRNSLAELSILVSKSTNPIYLWTEQSAQELYYFQNLSSSKNAKESIRYLISSLPCSFLLYQVSNWWQEGNWNVQKKKKNTDFIYKANKNQMSHIQLKCQWSAEKRKKVVLIFPSTISEWFCWLCKKWLHKGTRAIEESKGHKLFRWFCSDDQHTSWWIYRRAALWKQKKY